MDFDDAWALLGNAAAIGDHLTREEAIEGLGNGAFVLFTRDHSAALSAHCNGFLRTGLAGGDLSELRDIEREIDLYARSFGYPFVEIVGRPGWERVLPGYRRVAVVLRKELQ